MLVEICANSFESALAAQQGGADRIELCTELSVGGLTPSHGLIEKVVSELQIPVHVLIRPRSGNFTYSATELDIMLRDIDFCKTLGCAGIVSGTLYPDGNIAVKPLQMLISQAQDLCFTFHRAFDWCPVPFIALDTLKQHAVHRILTSGQQSTAEKGLPLLRQLQERADQKIEIMPGGGINMSNILLFQAEKFRSIHLSAGKIKQLLLEKPMVSMHSKKLFEEGIVTTSDELLISEIVSVCKG